jgi:hypothetical protein
MNGEMTSVASDVGGDSGDANVEDRTGNRQPGINPASYVREAGFTSVSLDLAERESVFVVIRDAAPTAPRIAPTEIETTLTTLAGEWTLFFPANWGAPASIQMPTLASWTSSADPGVKYFSGTATYTKVVQAAPTWFRPGRHLYLDLGKVRDIAEVEVNGKSAGMVWAPPYRVDVTDLLKSGTNHVDIKVTNEWTNRLVGDRLLQVEKRVLSQDGVAIAQAGGGGPFGGPMQPVESGLLGEVKVVAVSER